MQQDQLAPPEATGANSAGASSNYELLACAAASLINAKSFQEIADLLANTASKAIPNTVAAAMLSNQGAPVNSGVQPSVPLLEAPTEEHEHAGGTLFPIGRHGCLWIDRYTELHDREFARALARIAAAALDRVVTSDPPEPLFERFKVVADLIPAWIAYIDTNERYRFVNRKYGELFGIDPEKVVGMPISELLANHRFEERRRQMQRAFDGERVHYQIQMTVADGTVRDTEVQYVPDMEDGRVKGIVVMVHDVTEASKAERALERTQESLALAMKGGRMGWWTRDMLTDEVTWSAELEALFGLEPGAFQGTSRTFMEYVHPEDRERVGQAVMEAIRTGGDYAIEFRFARVDGVEGWMEGRGRAVYNDEGQPVGLYGIGIDITDRKQFEQALAAQEERFRHVADSVPVMVWTSSLARELTFVNDRWQSYFNLFGDDALRSKRSDRMHPDDIGHVMAEWDAAEREKRDFSIECRLKRHDGSYRWHLSLARPDLVNGEVVAWTGGIVDIHEQKTTEQALRFLFELDQATRGLEDPAEVMRVTARMLGEHLAVDRCAYAEVEADEDHFVIQGDYTRGVPSIVGRYSLAAFGARCLELHRAGQPFVVNDAKLEVNDAGDLEAYRQTGIGAVISVPMLIGGRFAAGMAVHTSEPRKWTEDEIRLLEVVAERSWSSIDRIRASRELRESEERLRYALGAADAGAWYMDQDTGIGSWDAQCYLLYGFDPAAGPPTYERWIERLLPEDRERLQTAVEEALRAGRDFRAEYRIHHPELGIRWIVSAGGLVGSRANRLTGISYDVTEERARVATLEATLEVGRAISELDTERVVQALADASTKACGAQFGAFFYNTRDDEDLFNLYVLSGASRDAFKGFPPVRATPLFSPTFREGETVCVEDVLADPRFAKMPHGGVPKGHLPVRSYMAVAVKARDGVVLGALLFGHSDPGRFTDDHVQLIEAFAAQASVAFENALLYLQLRQANEDLERKVGERTSELRSANEALTGFNYHVSHDLRTPLRAIVSTSRILEEDFAGELSESAKSLLKRQAESANRLSALIDDLLRFSRLSQEQPQVTDADLSHFSQEAAAEALFEHPNDAIRFDIQQGVSAQADPSLIRLVMFNLIGNAVKYSPDGGTVRFGQLEDGRYFVSDQGIGIEEAYLEKIFEPFQRLHRDDEFGGNGIGLANVRQIIERHGGRVWAESTVGEGSTFYFVLP